jgi:hypothetical protein
MSERVEELKEAYAHVADALKTSGISLNESMRILQNCIIDIEKEEKRTTDGMYWKFPCRPGDTLYRYNIIDKGIVVQPMDVFKLEGQKSVADEPNLLIHCVTREIRELGLEPETVVVSADQIGKSVFETPEEAVIRLSELHYRPTHYVNGEAAY